MTDDALSGPQTPPEPGPPAGPPGSPAGPAGEDTRPGEGVAQDAGHRDIAIDATGYVLSREPGLAAHARARPLGPHELRVVHAECGQAAGMRVGPGDDMGMILDMITGHDLACPHARPGATLAEPMAAGFMPHKVGQCWCGSGHDTDQTIALNRELTDALGLDRAGRPIGNRRAEAAAALGIDLPGVPAEWEDRRREFMTPDPAVMRLAERTRDDEVVEAHIFTDDEHPVPCPDTDPHSAHEWNGGTIWCEGR